MITNLIYGLSPENPDTFTVETQIGNWNLLQIQLIAITDIQKILGKTLRKKQ